MTYPSVTTVTTFPALADVDCSDSRQLAVYGHFIASALRNCEAGLSGFDPSDRLFLLSEGEKWIFSVEKYLSSPTPQFISAILQWYDIVHRLVFYKPADFDKSYTYVRKALANHAKGLPEDKPFMMNWFRTALLFHPNLLESFHIDWYDSVLRTWFEDLVAEASFPKGHRSHGAMTVSITDHLGRSLPVVNFLLDSDLSPFTTDQNQIKREIVRLYLPLLDSKFLSAENMRQMVSSGNTSLIETLPVFAIKAMRYFPETDYETVNRTVLEFLSNDSTLDPITRLAFSLDLTYI